VHAYIAASQAGDCVSSCCQEGAPPSQDDSSGHVAAGRAEIARVLREPPHGGIRAPQLPRRPPKAHRAHWVHAALRWAAASDGGVAAAASKRQGTVQLQRESEKLVAVSAQLSTRVQEKGAECEQLRRENAKLVAQLQDGMARLHLLEQRSGDWESGGTSMEADQRLAAAHEAATGASPS
jgi:hypothetical protein